MAITAGQVTTSSTLEQFRVEFNKLQTDVSGIEAGSLSFTNISATQISVAELTVTSTLSAASFIFEGTTDDDNETTYRNVRVFISSLIGAILGFVSGVVGVGGGIFLSPILFLIKAAKPKHIVTAASLFIFINSISGVIGQLTKNIVLSDISNYWYLFLVVIIGGHIGNYLNLKIFPTRLLALITSVLVLFVAIRIGAKLFL